MSMVGVPLKTVVMFHADTQNETITAEGWEVCDGRTLDSTHQDINPGSTYTLPDLRNVFPIGADITAATGSTGSFSATDHTGAPGPKGQPGANAHTNTLGEMVPHNHGVTDPGHSHTATRFHSGTGSSSGNTISIADFGVTSTIGTGITINNAGSGSAYDIRPRSYGLVFIMKVRI